jgi:hypothetical protein
MRNYEELEKFSLYSFTFFLSETFQNPELFNTIKLLPIRAFVHLNAELLDFIQENSS